MPLNETCSLSCVFFVALATRHLWFVHCTIYTVHAFRYKYYLKYVVISAIIIIIAISIIINYIGISITGLVDVVLVAAVAVS